MCLSLGKFSSLYVFLVIWDQMERNALYSNPELFWKSLEPFEIPITEDQFRKHQSKYCMFQRFSEKAMATHSSTLAWKIPWMEEPGRLQSMRSRRIGHDWATSLSLFTFLHWRRQWQPTPVFLPGESQGRGSLVGCRLWGRTESEMTEVTQQQCYRNFFYALFFCLFCSIITDHK